MEGQERPTPPAQRPSGPSAGPNVWVILQLIAAVAAAVLFVVAGLKMGKIESVSGDSIDEAFFNAFSFFSYAMAAVAAGVAVRVIDRMTTN